MNLLNILKLDVRDIPSQLRVLFPKIPEHNEKRKRKIYKRVVSLVGGNDGENYLYCGRYVTAEDIENKRRQLGI